MTFEVQWTGAFPNLCSGEWIIKKNGEQVVLPEDVQTSSMGTYGTYQSWHFEDWNEVFEDYEDGLMFEDWIKENKWAVEIASTIQEQMELYFKISQEDWRHDSCGGCS